MCGLKHLDLEPSQSIALANTDIFTNSIEHDND